jgi:hypothetical protein
MGVKIIPERRPLLPYLVDELVVEQVGQRCAQKAEHDDRYDRAYPRRVTRRGDEGEGSHEHRPDGEREEGRRCRRHVLVPVLQLDDEVGDGAAGRRAKDRQGAEELAEPTAPRTMSEA